jgi:transcriptional regulator with XRE-family HTH domain
MDRENVVTFRSLPQGRQPSTPQPAPSRFADGRTFGEFLRNHRERRGISLQEIADRTKIVASRFEALERGDFRLWPPAIYRRAIVRDYAAAIGLDPHEIVQEFVKLFPVPDPNVVPEAGPEPERVALRVMRLGLMAHAVQRRPRLRRSAVRPPSAPAGHARHRVLGTLSVMAIGAILGGSAASLITWYVALRSSNAVESSTVTAPERMTQLIDSAPPTEEARPTTGVSSSSAARDTTAVAVAPRPSVQRVADEPSSAASGSVEGRLRVTSDPSGARVTVNGIGWGSTPLTINHLPPGSKQIRASKDGYRTAERAVELTAGRPTVTVRLELRPMTATSASAGIQ